MGYIELWVVFTLVQLFCTASMIVPVLLSPAISIDINNVVPYPWKSVQSYTEGP